MEIFYEIKPHLLKRSSIALGFFDGVHLGHQAVIDSAIRAAKESGLTPAIVTFKDHPRAITDGNSPLLLTLIEQRLAIFKDLGIEAALVLTFTEELCRLSPQEYVETVLVGGMGANVISVGYNHHFGRRREGDPQLLVEFGKSMGFSVQTARPVFVDNMEVSSSKIREYLATANLGLANKLLSRPFSIYGAVVHGEGRGRQIGFPTANIGLSPIQMSPPQGVYVAQIKLPDKSGEAMFKFAVVNIGQRPTFAQSQSKSPTIEAHIFDFTGDIYGQNVEVYFHKYLRAEQKFDSVQELQRQIDIDCQIAKEWLSSTFSST